MTTQAHDARLIGAYVLNTMDPTERAEMVEHLSECAACRADLAELEAVRDTLGDIPPEALLHGPPDADLVLQRTLRQIRTEKTAAGGRRRVLTIAAATVGILGALSAGVVVGRSTSGGPGGVVALPTVTASTQAPPAGIRSATVVDPHTNTWLTASVTPSTSWVRINASVTGIPAGQNCRLVVVGRDGSREIAAGWVVTEQGATDGTNLDGSAAIPPDDVVAVEVRNTDGKTFVHLDI